MAKLTGYYYKEHYQHGSPHVRRHIAYAVPKNDQKFGPEYFTGVPELIYYVDKDIDGTSVLCAKETALVWAI